MNYFLINKNAKDKKRELINLRRRRKCILGRPNMGKLFTRGDILTVNF
jgi:hypothetical protein